MRLSLSWRALLLVLLCVGDVADGFKPPKLQKLKHLQDEEVLQSPQAFWPHQAHVWKSILRYKPPVGIVATMAYVRVFWILIRFWEEKPNNADEYVVLNRVPKHLRKHDRKLKRVSLDADDQQMDAYGGVERVRGELCLAILESLQQQQQQQQQPSSSSSSEQAAASKEALRIQHRSRSSRISFVEKVAQYLMEAEPHLRSLRDAPPTLVADKERLIVSIPEDTVLRLAAKIVEIRALDALLRSCRDRLLRTSSNHLRTVSQLEFALKQTLRLPSLLQVSSRIQKSRAELTTARAAYQQGLELLGHVQRLVMTRPTDLGDMELSEAYRRTSEQLGTTDHKTISNNQAWNVLVNHPLPVKEWLQQSHGWTQEARLQLYRIFQERRPSSIAPAVDMTEELIQVHRWSEYDYTSTTAMDPWTLVVMLVSELDRDPEFKLGIRLQRVIRKIDVFGIPSGLASVGVAAIVHNLVAPRWNQVRQITTDVYERVITIINLRLWLPFWDIAKEYFNEKDSALLEFLDIENEIQSLDNMLQDLGFGDGTFSTREEALRMAARQYEEDLQGSLLTNLVSGRLVRLMLMQIQQLKAGLLRALEDIDSLVQSNRLNVRLLAAIPAALLAFAMTRFAAQAIVSREFRPLRWLHEEMGECLHEMEKILIESGGDNGSSWPPSVLGRFVTQVHSYLVFLAYCSPPFSVRACGSIRKSLQEMLGIGFQSLRPEQQIRLLRLVREQHIELLKYI